MILRRLAVRFFLLFMACFAVALVAWNLLLAVPYGNMFRAAGGALAIDCSPWSVSYSRSADPTTHRDTEVLFHNRRDSLKSHVDVSSYRIAYLPTVLLVALIVATPRSARSKRVAVVWGLFAIHLVIALLLVLIPPTYVPRPDDESAGGFLRAMFWVLTGASAGWMMMPVTIWLAVSVWPLIRGGFAAANTAPPNENTSV